MRRPTILIVEDEILIARELEIRLRELGYEPLGIASSGGDAIQMTVDLQPDLVVMDIVLKGDVDGIEAAAEIRRRCQVPVIYLTAYADRETLERARITEPFGYVVKPFSERELEANVEMALYKHRSEARLRRFERWFSSAIEEVADAVIATDPEGIITVFNAAAEAITDWPRELAYGRPFHEVFRLVHPDGEPIELRAAIEAPVVRLASETHLLDRSDRRIPVDTTVSCMRDDSSRPSGLVSVFRDPSGHRHGAPVALQSEVSAAAAQALTPRGMLQLCAESIVRHMNAAFARIWTLDERGSTLVLQASAGLYTHLDGAHSRIAVGELKIGRIAAQREPHFTNDVLGDPWISDPEWARRERMRAFAGYPLLVDGRLVGVMGLFARQTLSNRVLEALASIGQTIAVALERKQAEQSLRATQARLQDVLSVSPAVIYSLQLEERRITSQWVSDNVEDLLGRPAPASDDLGWFGRHLHPDDRALAGELSPELFERGEAVWELRMLHRDGSYRWIRDEQRLVRDPSSRVVQCVGSWSDVSQRKRAEQALRESEARLREVTDNAGTVLWLSTVDGSQMLYVSPAYETVWRRSRSSLQVDPSSWQEPIHPEDRPGVEAGLRQVRAGEPGTLSYRLVLEDGSQRFIEDHRFPVKDRRERVVRIAGYAEDVTERRALEHQFQQAQKMEAVGRLAGGVAHDFNNLLTVISGYSEILLSTSAVDDHAAGLVREIRSASERAAALTRQLLAFSRRQVVEPRLVDLNALVRSIEKMLRRLIGEDVSLDTALQPGLPPVWADLGQLEQVLLNLAVNARDAMPNGGKLTLETKEVEIDRRYADTHLEATPGSHVLLAVSDSGAGMTREVMTRAFEPFFTTKQLGEGTGLGLSTVYGIVKQSGGHVSLYSELGTGTAVKVYLPVAAAERPEVDIAPSPASPTPTGHETILVVEDDEAVRVIAQHSLEALGYTVIVAAGGGEALRLVDRHPGAIHLLFTDVVMPEMSGRLLSEQLRERRAGIRVLYMSGYTDDAIIRHGVLREGTAFLQKPFTPHTLGVKVREVLDRGAGRRPTRE